MKSNLRKGVGFGKNIIFIQILCTACKSGHRIAKANSDITLRQISDALENTLVKASWRSGNPDKKCLVASGMSVVMDELVTGMNRSCNDYLERITIQKVEERLTALKEEKDNETGGCLSCQ